MKPCPECGSEDRYREEDHYALLRVTKGDSPTANDKLDLSGTQTDGYTVALIRCVGCGAVALTTAQV
jgi:hypothetical protein